MLFDQTYSNFAQATADLTDHSLDLGLIDPGNTGQLVVNVKLDVTASPGSVFTSNLLVANATPGAGVPEPSCGLLGIVALLTLSRRRVRRDQRAIN